MTTELHYAFEQYKNFYEDSAFVHDGICHDKKLKEEIKHWLVTRGAGLAELPVHEIIGKSLRRSENYPNILKKLIEAFELLELAAVNLILFPWRKEFKTIKTFSGAYLYQLKPAICHEDLGRIFMKMGYVQKDNLELEMKDLPDCLQLIRLAFNLFVARIECEILSEVVGKLDHFYKVSVEELFNQRILMIGVDASVDKQNLTYSAAATQRENQCFKKRVSVSSGEDIDVDLIPDLSANNPTSPPLETEYKRSAIHSLSTRMLRSSSSDQDKDDAYSRHMAGIPVTDCIYSTKIKDGEFEESQDLPNDKPDHNSVSSCNIVGNVFDLEGYEMHNCLAEGESIRYCCATCGTAHTISCDRIKDCTGLGHAITFLEAENSDYPQQAEAACDAVPQLSYADILKMDPACMNCRCLPMHICNGCGMFLCNHCGFRSMLKCIKCDIMLEKLN
ncbi:spermatogenesis associated 2-like [Rhinoraja longicauda]